MSPADAQHTDLPEFHPELAERPPPADRLKHLAAAIRALIAVGISFQLLHWTDAQIGTVMMAIEAVGALIYASRRR